MQSTPVEVLKISPADGPAAKAGLQPHDLVIDPSTVCIRTRSRPCSPISRTQAGKPGNPRPSSRNGISDSPAPSCPSSADTSEGKGLAPRLPPSSAACQGRAALLCRGRRRLLKVLTSRTPSSSSTSSTASSPARSPSSACPAPSASASRSTRPFRCRAGSPHHRNHGHDLAQPRHLQPAAHPHPRWRHDRLPLHRVLIRRDLNQQIKERVYQVAFVCLVALRRRRHLQRHHQATYPRTSKSKHRAVRAQSLRRRLAPARPQPPQS